MLTVCRQHYQNKDRILKDIGRFDRTYHIDDCISWYTMETFVYQLINKALRTGNIEQLYTFRYYISDLSKQLAEKCKNIKNGKNEIFNLYRGTKIYKKEAEKFKANVGKLIATNSYWSTSCDDECAQRFANKSNRDADFVAVLFEIKCDLKDKNDSIILADISGSSVFSTEQEFLIDIGSVFQIEKIREETKGNIELHIELRTTEKGREVAKNYIEENRREMEYKSPKMMLGILLKRIGEHEKSLRYFQHLLENPGEENIACIHNRIGIALRNKNEDDLALDHFNKAYALSSKVEPSKKRLLASILHNIGIVNYKKREFNEALKHYKKAVDIVKEETSDTNRFVAELYSSIGRAYLSLKNYNNALYYQTKALRIRKSCLSSDHVILAFSYIDIAKIFCYQKKYKQALEYHLIALRFREQYLLPNHLNTAWSLHHVGKMYYKNRDSKTARDYYLKSLEMTRNCLPLPQHHNVPKILEDIALTYHDNIEKALEY